MTNDTYLTETNKLIEFDTEIGISKSSNRYNNHKTGKIVNVSRNMVVLKESKTKKIIKIAKKEISFFQVHNQYCTMTLPGKRLLGRPEEIIV